ncbi:phospholipid carrier-dependent glycosyltransferase [Candidatus Scalindua japonica]|uniref:phospholipid carrier-dependent glycosyltransferase n=1 Tax=Candidatus Scalindua japonica TaxID=1284222 RepID=UPI000BDEF071|nr:phospholipid carrier-dependent glycosyltransferase [Candidatus Scalindua japonica]
MSPNSKRFDGITLFTCKKIHTITVLKKGVIGLSILFLLLYIAPMNVRPVAVPDEARYGEISREMLDTKDFIVPRLNGLRYFEKPVLGYWLNSESMALFGDNGFAIRFPSALAVGLTALTIFLMVRRFYKCDRTALLAAFIYMTFVGVYGVGTFCVPDNLLTFFLTAMLSCFFVAGANDTGKKRNRWLLLCGVFCGAAFMTKGFLVIIVPTVIMVPFLLWERRWRVIFTVPWLPLLGAIVVALPWCFMIASREPDFWRYFFWVEHVQRFFSADSGMHEKPFWFLIPFFLDGSLPWLLFIPVVLVRWNGELLRKPLIRFCVCWMILPLVFFSISSGKTITYVLPCFPPLAVLLGIGLTEYFRKGMGGMFKYCSLLLNVLTGLMVVALLSTVFTPDLHRKIYGSGEDYKLWYCVCAAVVCFVVLLITLRMQNGLRKTFMHGLPAIIIMLAFPFAVPIEHSVKTGMSTFLHSQQDHITTNTILVADSRSVQPVCYAYKRDDVYLFMRAGELRYGLSYPDSAGRFIDTVDLKKWLNERGNRQVAIIIKESTKSRSGVSWPEPGYQATWNGCWFAVY